jgi:hypothetical protein
MSQAELNMSQIQKKLKLNAEYMNINHNILQCVVLH